MKPGGRARGAVRRRGQHRRVPRASLRAVGDAGAVRRAPRRLGRAVELRRPRITAQRSSAAGFDGDRAGSQPWPVEPEEPREFVQHRLPRAASRAPSRGAREPYLDEVMARLARAADARLRAPEHLAAAAADAAVRADSLRRHAHHRHPARRRDRPRDHGGGARAAAHARRDFEFDEHARSAAPSIDAHGTALTDEVLARLPGRRRRAARRGRRPQVGHDRPRRAAPGAGPARPAQGPGACSPTCARSARAPRCSTPARSSASGSRAPTCSSCASSPAASTSARAARDRDDSGDDLRASTPPPRSSGSREVAFRFARTKVTSVDKANVLETSRLWREVVTDVHGGEVPRHAARPPARRQRRDAARLAPVGLRRDRHREPVRRHPQRRGGDDHRLDRDAARAPRSAPAAPACSSRSTAPRRTSPAPGMANPLAMFGSVAMMLRYGLGWRTRPPR